MSKMVSVFIIIAICVGVLIVKIGCDESIPTFWTILVLAVVALAILKELT